MKIPFFSDVSFKWYIYYLRSGIQKLLIKILNRNQDPVFEASSICGLSRTKIVNSFAKNSVIFLILVGFFSKVIYCTSFKSCIAFSSAFITSQCGMLASLEWNKKPTEQRITKSTSPQHQRVRRESAEIKLMNKTSAHYNFKSHSGEAGGYICFLRVCRGFLIPYSTHRHSPP
jgi:hypothetical protein